MKLLRLVTLAILALFGRVSSAQTPATYNLRPFAFDIYHAGEPEYGGQPVRWLHIADSFGALPSGGRFHVGVRDVIKPYRWSGWYHTSAASGLNPSPTTSDPSWTVSPSFTSPTNLFTNHFTYATTQTGNAGTNDGNSYVIGQMCNGNGGSPIDTVNGPVGNANAMYTRFPNVNSRALGYKCSPHDFRELAFAGNVADSTTCFEWVMDYRSWNRFQSRTQPTSTANKYGNWGVDGDTVTARLIYVQNPEAPTSLIWRATRNGTVNNSTSFNPNGPLAVKYVDADFSAVSTSGTANYLRPRIVTDALGTNESTGGTIGGNTILPILGVRYFRPNSPGLEFATWSQPGWSASQMIDSFTYDTIEAARLSEWLTALGWPTHISIQLGQNQPLGQQTELNAGTSTGFKADYQALVDLLNSRYDAAGRSRPKYLFFATWRLQSDVIVSNGRTELNYTTVAQAVYELAQANGASFVNFQAFQHTPEDFTDNSNRGQILWSTDDVHPSTTGSGSLYYVGATWAQMLGSLDSNAAGLRGRRSPRRTHSNPRSRTPARRKRRVPAHANIDRSRRVGLSIGFLIAIVSACAGGVGTLVAVKTTAAEKDAQHDKELADHESRIRTVERETTDRMGRIETKLDEVLKRLK